MDLPWWASTTIYQAYPRSFADSDGDGIGDLPGIIDHLDHLVDLGVGTLWVSPFFASPQADFGYDITDYCDVAPEYGTVSDAERLVEEAHRRGIRVMFDLVLNHTSDQHPWFVESRASRDNSRADWYVWADGRRSGRRRRPPNNWRDVFRIRSGWNWDPTREQYYLASFLPFQPDLNWHNPEVRAAMFDAVRFWLDRGVDGFRLDMFGSMMKDPQLRSNPIRPRVRPVSSINLFDPVHSENTDACVELATELRAVCDAYDGDRVLLGEVFGSTEEVARFTDGGRGLQLVFLFDFLEYRYDARWLRDTVNRFETHFPAPLQPTYVLENHDRTRLLSRVGGDLHKARVMAVVLCTLRGVPTIYQGQELGMPNTSIPLDEAKDPVARSFSWVPDAVLSRIPETVNRDDVRVPMQWTPGPNAGFSPPGATPWLPAGSVAPERNVETERDDSSSMLALYRDLFHLRRDRPALNSGGLDFVAGVPSNVFAFVRQERGERILVAANLGPEPSGVAVDPGAEVLISSGPGVEIAESRLVLPSDRAAVVRVG